MRKARRWLCAVFVAGFFAPVLHADVLDDLARDFWKWRATEMPGLLRRFSPIASRSANSSSAGAPSMLHGGPCRARLTIA